MNITPQVKLTPKFLTAILENHLLKMKFTEKDKNFILEQPESFNARKTLEKVIQNSDGRLDIYGPANELLHDLREIMDFPNNYEILGVYDQMIYGHKARRFHIEDRIYLLKSHIFLILYHAFREKVSFDVAMLVLESVGNEVYRRLENSHEFILMDSIDDLVSNTKLQFDLFRCNEEQMDQLQIVCGNLDQLLLFFKAFFDKENDAELIERCRKQLENLTQEKPIHSNNDFYRLIYQDCFIMKLSCVWLVHSFPDFFKPYDACSDSEFDAPIRVFRGITSGFYFVKDLQNLFSKRKNIKIPIETDEEREEGIVNTMSVNKTRSYHENKNIDCISESIDQTDRGAVTPTISPYGTLCKLASDAFYEVFEIFTKDLRWFDSVSDEHFPKIFTFFEENDIFNDTKKCRYFIELWKIKEIKNDAYTELQHYTNKVQYNLPKNKMTFTKDETLEELKKLCAPQKFEYDFFERDFLRKSQEVGSDSIGKCAVFQLYDECWRAKFLKQSEKFRRFIHNQTSCPILDGFSCDCEKKNAISDGEIELEILELDELNHHHIEFLDEYKYFMFTKNGQSFYDNDSCLKNALDFDHCELVSLIFKAEIDRSWKTPKNVFYLTKKEVDEFSENMGKLYNDSSKNIYHIEEINGRKEIRKMLKNYFPVHEYSKEFCEKIHELVQNEEDLHKCLQARFFFKKCSETMDSFEEYSKVQKERRIVLRIMCEMRVENQKDWHFFSEELLTAIEIALKNENRLEQVQEKIEKWRSQWITGVTFTTVPVSLFETILSVVGLPKSKFILVPDIEFCKNLIFLPLTMGYKALGILSPDGRKVYHQVQAQFLIYQFGACDVLWNNDELKKKNKHKKKLLEEMKKVEKGYHLAENIHNIVKKFMFSDVTQKTPLTAFHSKPYNYECTEEQNIQFTSIYKDREFSLGKVKCMVAHMKMLHMMRLMGLFDVRVEADRELKVNIAKAYSVTFPIFELKSMADFNTLKLGTSTYFNKMNLEGINQLCYQVSDNSALNFELKKGTFVLKHYAFNDSDPLGAMAKKIKSEKIFEVAKKSEKEGSENTFLRKFMQIIPEVLPVLSEVTFEPIDVLLNHLQEAAMCALSENDHADVLRLVMNPQNTNKMQEQLREYIDYAKIDGQTLFRKKKLIGMDKKQHKIKMAREEEPPKIVTKYVTETKTVEICEKCRNIEKETIAIEKKIEYYQTENEKNQKIILQKEDDLTNLRSQNSLNKLKYRDEIQKYKENVESRERKIEQLQQEIKEYREDLKVERENLYADVRKSSRISEENSKKMRVELENLKFSENNKAKQNEELMAEVEQLKIRLQMSEEECTSYKNGLLKAEEKLKNMQECGASTEDTQDFDIEEFYLDSDFENLSDFEKEENDEILYLDVHDVLQQICDNSKKHGIPNSEIASFRRKYDVYMRIVENDNCWQSDEFPNFNVMLSPEFMQRYEHCLKQQELYDCVICTNNIGIGQLITTCATCSSKYHSECASSWLQMNSVCPMCRTFLPDPFQYPFLH